MNNYVKIFSLEKNLYAAGYPVVIEAGSLFRNNDNGKLHFQLKFRNISEKNVVSLKTIIILMDSMGREIYRAPKQYDDLRAAPSSTFGEKMPVFLKLNTVRRFAVCIEEVCFSDNTLWYSKGDENVVNIPDPSPLSDKFPSSEAQAEFRRTLCMQARFVPFGFEDLWICSCGTINKNTRKNCSSCGADCEKMLAADNDTLKNQYLSYKKKIETRRIYDEASALVEKYDSALCIVNPAKRKFEETVLEQSYYDLLRIYANELDRNNALLLVFGFSFADEHILELTKRAIRSNPKLIVIISCHTRSDAAWYRSLFPNADNVHLLVPKEDKEIGLGELTEVLRCVAR